MQLDGSGGSLLVSGMVVYLESGIKHLLAYVLVWISGFVGEQIMFFQKLLGKFLIFPLLHFTFYYKEKIPLPLFSKVNITIFDF